MPTPGADLLRRDAPTARDRALHAAYTLDEPTIGLDPQTRRHIWTYLRNLRESARVTLFMTTHYMDEAEECDRIAVIDGGRIVALGTPAELKGLAGGDAVTIATGDNARAAAEIASLFEVDPMVDKDNLRIEVPMPLPSCRAWCATRACRSHRSPSGGRAWTTPS